MRALIRDLIRSSRKKKEGFDLWLKSSVGRVGALAGGEELFKLGGLAVFAVPLMLFRARVLICKGEGGGGECRGKVSYQRCSMRSRRCILVALGDPYERRTARKFAVASVPLGLAGNVSATSHEEDLRVEQPCLGFDKIVRARPSKP